MNWKNWTLTFLLALFIIFSVPNNLHAESLGFYSKIDDAGDSLANQLIKRHLQDFSSFREFGKSCRGEVAWLDTQPINQEMLEDLEKGNIEKFTRITKTPLSTEELQKLTSCLNSTYAKIKDRAREQQKTLEDSASIGLYMDGNTNNSDFDIITDIEKINAIIFTKSNTYDGTANTTNDKLNDFLKGKTPEILGGTPDTNNSTNFNATIVDNSSTQNTNTANTTTTSTNSTSWLGNWSAMCTPDSNSSAAVNNMMTDDFLKDLNSALWGQKSGNVGADYSDNFARKNNNTANGNNTSDSNSNTDTQEKEDFASKLPCNGIFCITIGTNIGSQNLLTGGKGGNSIEDILDKHIEKTEEISWSDLSAQKMNNNSFQLPFLNTKFSKKVAGGQTFIHNSPQITKTLKEEQTPQKQLQDFDTMYRCAMISAKLSTDEKKNSSILGTSFVENNASNTENIQNLVLPTDPQDTVQLTNNTNCAQILLEEFRKQHYSGFSTQVNEISAFTAAMLDIINQILDQEKRLDNIPVR